MRRFFYKFVELLLLLVLMITTIYGYMELKDKEKDVINVSFMTKEMIQDYDDGISSMKEINENEIQSLQRQYNNSEIKGVISIVGLDFHYPVAQTKDNEYYLNHNYKKQEDVLGSIYADYRVNLDYGRKKLIYGHSSTKTTTPFNQLENYYEEDYYKKYPFLELKTETNTYKYEIFSVYVETTDFTYMNLKFDTEEEWYYHIMRLQNRSIYSIDVELKPDDEVLILQTCSNHSKYKNNSKKYLLIVSRRIK